MIPKSVYWKVLLGGVFAFALAVFSIATGVFPFFGSGRRSVHAAENPLLFWLLVATFLSLGAVTFIAAVSKVAGLDNRLSRNLDSIIRSEHKKP